MPDVSLEINDFCLFSVVEIYEMSAESVKDFNTVMIKTI